MGHLVSTGSGEWVDSGKTQCRIYYRSPQEWAARLHAHVESTAMSSSNTLYTLFELHSGDALYGTGERAADVKTPLGLFLPVAEPSYRPPWSHLHHCPISCVPAEFAGMEPELLLKALEVLEAQGAVELFRAPGGPLDEVGVRFKPRR